MTKRKRKNGKNKQQSTKHTHKTKDRLGFADTFLLRVYWIAHYQPKPNCSVNILFPGYAAGQLYIHTSYTARYGGPSNILCLPHDPEPSNITANGNSLLYGTEYQENILAPDSADEDVPCAVCRSTMTQTSIMIPGREACYPGWKKEYHGLIASGHRAYTSSSYICLDKNIEYIPSGKTNNDGALLYITTLKCGSLPCPPYHDDKAINCVVCSK
jgi:hypothetical protein